MAATTSVLAWRSSPLPEPFDFALTTERFRAFGARPREPLARGRAAPRRRRRARCGSRRRPAASTSSRSTPRPSPSWRALLGLAFDLDGLRRLGGRRRGARGARARARRLPAARSSPDPFEMLVGAITSQQVSLFSARAIRNRLIERFGEPAGVAWAFPSRERLAAATRGGALRARLLAPQGGVRRRARALRPRPRRARAPARRRR